MKTERKMLVAFLLNFGFALLEAMGGIFTGSIAILSDALHDLGDAMGILLACILEKKSKQKADERYTYGYGRYSVLGGVITTLILLFGSLAVIVGAVERLLHPVQVDYNGVMVLAVLGVAINFLAAYVTHDHKSLNQKAVNLHLLEDVLGWIVVLLGGVVMRFTGWDAIDPILSIAVAVFIGLHALKTLKEALGILLEKVPAHLHGEQLQQMMCLVDGVKGVHHFHLWTIGENQVCATAHLVAEGDFEEIKKQVKHLLNQQGVFHITLELEREECEHFTCCFPAEHHFSAHGHHHH